MPFDGIVSKCVVDELNGLLSEGRVEKVFQTERDEITMLVRARGDNRRLLLSASPSMPRMHLTAQVKDNPVTPPVFCMLLRKHVAGGRIDGFRLYDFDRIIEMTVKTTNDFGEPCTRYVIIEIMGRHSNIMLLNENRIIIDSIKHVDNEISSVREVMPGRHYQMPPAQDKISPAEVHGNRKLVQDIFQNPKNEELRADKVILENIRGFSPMLSREACERAELPELIRVRDLSQVQVAGVVERLEEIIDGVMEKQYAPAVYFKDEKLTDPFDFHCIPVNRYGYRQDFSTISEALDFFYKTRDNLERLGQKKSGLMKIISNNIERCMKKIGIQEDSLTEAAKMDTYKLYGELLTANIHKIQDNLKSITVSNYYTDPPEDLEISLDPSLSGSRNAQRYFKKYAKARSTRLNAEKQLLESRAELNYLESVHQMLEMADNALEIDEIRAELAGEGYVREKTSRRKKEAKSEPARAYKSSDGFDILVGRNNRANDELTLRLAANTDLWFHTKDIPGSHVIIKTARREVPERTILEAAILAAYYSKASKSRNVPVDYTLVKNVHKPQGAKPGMVIYDSQHTLYVTPDEEMLRKLL